MPLTAAQRRHLEQRLLEERDRVAQALARYADATRDSRQEETGDLTAFPSGADTEGQEFDAANAARETIELGEIDAALERLHQRPDEYGRCERAGEPISFERLDALPWARTCIAHST
jgi:RNA polymerase-binding transcription factor